MTLINKIWKGILLVVCSVLLASFLPYEAVFLSNSDTDEKIQKTTADEQTPFYKRRHNFDCAKILNGDSLELQLASNVSRPIRTEMAFLELLQNCSHFLNTVSFYSKKPMSPEEAEFPLAYAINVNEDTEYVESLVNSIYAPQNHYCIHVDLRAPKIIHDVIHAFSKCLPNVYVAKSVSVSWGSYNMVQGMLNCLQELTVPTRKWKYAITLEGHDFPLKTNRQIVRILREFRGANDVDLLTPPLERYEMKRNWKLDRHGQYVENVLSTEKNVPPPDGLKIYWATFSASLTRDFVKFVLTNQTSLRFQSWLKSVEIPDEFVWSTLVHNEYLRAPGWFPGRCVGNAKKVITRLRHWDGELKLCYGPRRHSLCLFTIRDLGHLTWPNRTQLFLNKFWPQNDPIAVDCMQEWIFNRTYHNDAIVKSLDEQDMQFYRTLPAVRFQLFNAQQSADNVVDQFKCSDDNARHDFF